MPVYRWKNLEDMRRHRWLQPGDPRIWERFRMVVSLGNSCLRVHRPPGVHRFRTIEELQAFQESWRHERLCKPCDPPPGYGGRKPHERTAD